MGLFNIFNLFGGVIMTYVNFLSNFQVKLVVLMLSELYDIKVTFWISFILLVMELVGQISRPPSELNE